MNSLDSSTGAIRVAIDMSLITFAVNEELQAVKLLASNPVVAAYEYADAQGILSVAFPDYFKNAPGAGFGFGGGGGLDGGNGIGGEVPSFGGGSFSFGGGGGGFSGG
jgi:hypothetical protein